MIFVLKKILPLACCFIALTGYAQKATINLTGVVFKKSSSERLSNVLVVNLKTKAVAATDELGVFKIPATIGDTVKFSFKDYTEQKVEITLQENIFIYLQPAIQLSEISIKDMSKRQELNGIMKDYNSKGVYNNGKSSFLSSVFSPLNALYDVAGSGPKQAKRFQRFSAAELQQTEIDRRFNTGLIQKTTGLKDEKLKQFMDSYRPEYADLKKWNDYELIEYIVRSYKEFVVNGPKPTLQKLY